MSFRVGIDVGGTFTDITVLDEESGEIREVKKVPSDPAQPLAVLDKALSNLCAVWGGSSVSTLLHGSTHALNALLERKGSPTGLLMTEGFRDVYELGRQWKGDEVFNIFYPGPKRFVPRRLVGEARERLSAEGEVLLPLNLESLDQSVDRLVAQGIESLAVVFLFSYLNPTHERQAGERIRERYPQLFITLSSEVNPVWREYERTCTTVLNAYLGPRMEGYFSGLRETVRRHFPNAHPFLMKSNGGVETPATMAKFPLHSLMSGPVAGVMASHGLGQRKSLRNLITLDIGGTSCDMSLIPGEVLFRSESMIRHHPVRGDSVEVESLGAGGGSLAQVRFGRVLQVGSESAGSAPGPACYERGGEEPTLTDALVQLGHLNPQALLGGEMIIDRKRSEKAIGDRIAGPLGMSLEDASLGILRVLATNVVSSMRTITVERGYNPGDFALVAFGGMGPTLATAIASGLGLREIVIPTNPGNFSAYGMLLSDLRYDLAATHLLPLSEAGLKLALEGLHGLAERGERSLSEQGARCGGITVEWLLDMRYREQAYKLTVPISQKAHLLSLDEISEKFGAAHERRYGHQAEDEAIEIVNLRVRAFATLAGPRSPQMERVSGAERPSSHREISFPSGRVRVLVFDRGCLAAGFETRGPVVIEEKTSTVVVETSWGLRVDEEGQLRDS